MKLQFPYTAPDQSTQAEATSDANSAPVSWQWCDWEANAQLAAVEDKQGQARRLGATAARSWNTQTSNAPDREWLS